MAAILDGSELAAQHYVRTDADVIPKALSGEVESACTGNMAGDIAVALQATRQSMPY